MDKRCLFAFLFFNTVLAFFCPCDDFMTLEPVNTPAIVVNIIYPLVSSHDLLFAVLGGWFIMAGAVGFVCTNCR